ncbi:hypothetical protein [Persicobacter sp. CCB-QB2]|uniref:hypothetical protein n=1 Tax=Persicobacter sp. CCB-QB2 TaxID=1561025 RepID=UPI0006A98EE2|nr:hypothetical protein [Persicobacter sp. CCB-QB2]
MGLYLMKLTSDSLLKDGDTFSLNACAGFTVINAGDTTAHIGYVGEPLDIDIPAGERYSFPASSGYAFEGEMEIRFDQTGTGLVRIFKYVAKLNETIR